MSSSKATGGDDLLLEDTLLEARLSSLLEAREGVRALEAHLAGQLVAEDYAGAACALRALRAARLSSAALQDGAEAALGRALRWARFAHGVGAVVTHRRYGYRGVVAGSDATCQASPDWASAQRVDALARGRFQPFYHVLVDERDRAGGVTAYVAEENLVSLQAVCPVQHPLVDELFLGMSESGVYNPSLKLHMLFRRRSIDRELIGMASVEASLHALHAHVEVFSIGVTDELAALRRNLEQRPVSGATVYRHTLNGLRDESVAAGVETYRTACLQIRELEATLAQYGYRNPHSPEPPLDPLELMHVEQREQDSLQPGPGTGVAPLTTMRLARARQDTPSSLASAEDFSPSMRELLGKYTSLSVGSSQRLSFPAGSSNGSLSALDRPAAEHSMPSHNVTLAGPGQAAEVSHEAYANLPAFVRGQLSLELLNTTLSMLRTHLAARGSPEFGSGLLQDLGVGSKTKVFMNALLKLGLASLRVVQGQETVYIMAQ